MNDKRNTELAEVLLDAVSVGKKDKVVISTSDLLPIDLIREVYKGALARDAYVYLDIMGCNFFLGRSSYGDLARIFIDNATDDQIDNPPDIYKNIFEWGDKFVRITSLDNYAHLDGADPEKIGRNAKAYNDPFHTMIDNKDWVLTYYPTEAMAQRSKMSYTQFVDFYFDSVLVDYKEMEEKQRKLVELMDQAKEVRIVGEKTDLLLNIDGRLAQSACGKRNIPDGEVFLAPVHELTEGYIYYDLPFFRNGAALNGVYLEFKEGKVVNWSAEQGAQALEAGLNTDEGAKFLGELGLGMNYGIDRPMGHIIFDEKIGGTVHVTLGKAYESERGGVISGGNKSAIHWDLIKDMRKPGSYIEVDGEVKFKEGKWLL